MQRMLWLLAPLMAGGLITCRTTERDKSARELHERIGVMAFSIETPPGKEWQIEKTDSSITLQRRQTSWGQTIGVTLLCVSAHPIPWLAQPLSEKTFAEQFLEAEKRIVCEYEPGGDIHNTYNDEFKREGKTLYRMTYELHYGIRSDGFPWGDEAWITRTEIFAYFPESLRGRTFFCFEIRESRRAEWPRDSGSPWLIDQLIDSFELERIPTPAIRLDVGAPGP